MKTGHGALADRLVRACPPRDLPGPLALRLHAAHPGARLSRLSESPPYWAWSWPGGQALIAHLAAHPGLVAGRRVLDLGAGAGLVGIAALKLGAGAVLASDSDPLARAILPCNAALNAVDLAVTGDILDAEPPPVDLVLAGDVFYAPEVAARVLPFLTRCAAEGIPCLVGDTLRPDLPRGAFVELARYPVREFGTPPDSPAHAGAVLTLKTSAAGRM